MNTNKIKKRKQNKSRCAKKIVAFLVLFCICIGGISMISAKYIKQTTTNNNAATAKEFYFESDLLDGSTHEVTPTDNGTATVKIRLKNYVDELRYSETEIKYEISVKETGSDTEAKNITVSNGSGTISTGAKNYADIELSKLEAGKSYTVTATTDNIYHKTLKGTIQVSKPDTEINASVHDETQYIEVTIWTNDYRGDVALNYSNSIGLSPDNTDTKMKGKTIGDTITTSFKANQSHVFRFFKEDTSKNYDVKISGKEVTVIEKAES